MALHVRHVIALLTMVSFYENPNILRAEKSVVDLKGTGARSFLGKQKATAPLLFLTKIFEMVLVNIQIDCITVLDFHRGEICFILQYMDSRQRYTCIFTIAKLTSTQ
jgi:hypothetical protein